MNIMWLRFPAPGGMLRRLLKMLMVFCVLFTLLVMTMIAVNYHHLGQLVQVVTLVQSRALTPLSVPALVEGAARGIVEALNDPYSAYLDPKEFSELTIHVQGSFGGIGVVVGKREPNQFVVAAPPFKNTPAERAGLKQGDVIVRINGRETAEMDLDTAVALMRGEPGTEVRLTLQREGQKEPFDVVVVREIINIPTVQGRLLEEDPRIAYIQLLGFNTNTGADLKRYLDDLQAQGGKGIILDLRNNPGGEFGAALEVASFFVPAGPIVKVIGRDGKEEVHGADGRNTLHLPVVVLVNDLTASAAEIVAGAVKDRQAGILVGDRTYGKGVVQSLFPLQGGAGLKLTTSKYLTPQGYDIHQKGIEPDVWVKASTNDREDIVLKKAIDILRSQLQG